MIQPQGKDVISFFYNVLKFYTILFGSIKQCRYICIGD